MAAAEPRTPEKTAERMPGSANVHWISRGAQVPRAPAAATNWLTGYLLKQRSGGSNLVRRWHPRWFRLQDSKLAYQRYANSHLKRSHAQQGSRARNTIDLDHPSVMLVIEPKLFKAPTPYTFQLVSPHKVLNLCAQDEGNFYHWIEAIAGVIQKRDERLVSSPPSRPPRLQPALTHDRDSRLA